MSSRTLTLLTAASLLLFVCGDPSVDISLSPVSTVRLGDRVRVTCHISRLQSKHFIFKVRLSCPILPSSVSCFQNCKATCEAGIGCTAQQSELISSITCSSYRGSDKLQIWYEFPYSSKAFSGHYMCQFFGKNSARTLLPPPILPPPTTKPVAPEIKPTKPPKVAPTSKKMPAVKMTSKPPLPPLIAKCDGRACDPPVITNPELTLAGSGMTRERVLAFVVVLCILSIVVNTIFCVRCILINHYAKQPRKLQHMGCCMSGFLCLDPEVYLRKREPSMVLPAGCSASLMTPHIGDRDDAGGSDSTYSMPAYMPMSGARSQTIPAMLGGVTDSQKNIVLIPVMASSLSTLRTGSHPGLNIPLSDTGRLSVLTSTGAVNCGGGGSGGDSGVGASSRCLAVSPQQQQPLPQPPGSAAQGEQRRLSGSVSRLYGNSRIRGRQPSGDSHREVDEEETLIE